MSRVSKESLEKEVFKLMKQLKRARRALRSPSPSPEPEDEADEEPQGKCIV
jgi:hypothetical protein